MVRARSRSPVALLLVVFSAACLPLLQPVACRPINLAGTAPTLPTQPTSHKDSGLLSGKDFLSVFVASRLRHTSRGDTSKDPSDQGSSQSTPYPSTASQEETFLNGPQEDPSRSPTVVSIRVSSSVGGGDSGWSQRGEEHEHRLRSEQTVPTPKGIFTTFLDAFAETADMGVGKSIPEDSAASTSPAAEPTPLTGAEAYGSVGKELDAKESDTEELESGEGDQITSLSSESSRFGFPDRLGFQASPSPPYPPAVAEQQTLQPAMETRESSEVSEEENRGFSFPNEERNVGAAGVSDEPQISEELSAESPSDDSERKSEDENVDRVSVQPKPSEIQLPRGSFERVQTLSTTQPEERQSRAHEVTDASAAQSTISTSIHQRRDQKSLYRRYLRPRYPLENDFFRGIVRGHGRSTEPRYGAGGYQPEGEPAETNYEVSEEVSVASRGRVHGPQPLGPVLPTPPPTLSGTDSNRGFERGPESREPPYQSNQKFGYVVEGKNYRKYRVEERTSDGFIVGEYGVVNHEDGVLRGVRYTADGTINPRLIHEALIKFLSL